MMKKRASIEKHTEPRLESWADVLSDEFCTYVLTAKATASTSPFLETTYDYDSDFYQGHFKFEDPVSGEVITGTPEGYGRQRIVSTLLSTIRGGTIADIGAGSLNIMRSVTKARQDGPQYDFINLDVSGPWRSHGERSSMEVGMQRLGKPTENLRSIVNVQYDMNKSRLPLAANSVEGAVSCMAIHHANQERRSALLSEMYRSLKPNGTFLLVDLFHKEEGPAFTNAGKGGPADCGGEPESIASFLQRCKETGFILDEVAESIARNEQEGMDQKELVNATRDMARTLKINKALWFVPLLKKRGASYVG